MAEFTFNPTINIGEALNEKIKIIEEDLSKFNSDLQKVTARNAVAASKNAFYKTMALILWIATGLCLAFIVVLSQNCTEPMQLIIPAFLFVIVPAAAARKCHSKKNDCKVDTETEHRLKAKISELQADLQKAKAEKREIVLRVEREIKQQQADDVINENFSSESENKECPICAETVKAKAKVCRFCGHAFEG